MLTFVISIDIWRMAADSSGSLMSSFDSFIISVDFCNDPVTLSIAGTPKTTRGETEPVSPRFTIVSPVGAEIKKSSQSLPLDYLPALRWAEASHPGGLEMGKRARPASSGYPLA